MNDETFAVWEWLPEDWHQKVAGGLSLGEAVSQAKRSTDKPAVALGVILKVSITSEADDATVFLWERGKGVVYPDMVGETHGTA
jgi:hypothetical protein